VKTLVRQADGIDDREAHRRGLGRYLGGPEASLAAVSFY
jgi:hypothetical protein